jgi:hypothetical protein
MSYNRLLGSRDYRLALPRRSNLSLQWERYGKVQLDGQIVTCIPFEGCNPVGMESGLATFPLKDTVRVKPMNPAAYWDSSDITHVRRRVLKAPGRHGHWGTVHDAKNFLREFSIPTAVAAFTR